MRLRFLVLLCLAVCGCRDSTEPADPAAAPAPSRPVVLEVLVVDDAELATGIQLLSGEWNERTGGEISVAECSLEELLAQEQLTADLVIYPTRHLGTLVDRGWLRPVRRSVLEDPDYDLSDVFPALRNQAIRLGGEVYALPLGDPPLVLASGEELPQGVADNWEQFDAMERRLPENEPGAFPYPLAAELLARTLATTPPRDWPSLLFDSLTMQARLELPQVVRAVERMIAQLGSDQPTGEEQVAHVALPGTSESAAPWFTVLPRANQWYEASLNRWQPHEAPHSPMVLGLGGRLVSVTQASRNAASAFQLLPWLTRDANATQLSQRSENTLWFRSSQSPRADGWLPRHHAGGNLAPQLSEQLSRSDAYLFPRLPGVDEYLSTLEQGLQSAIQEGESPHEALRGVEAQWNTITERCGVDRQRAAYRKHLGVE